MFNITISFIFLLFLLLFFPSSSSVQSPQLALTLHWRASTTVTRDLGSHWTNCATSPETVHSAMTKATYVVSTLWHGSPAVDQRFKEESSPVSQPSCIHFWIKTAELVSRTDSSLMKRLHSAQRGNNWASAWASLKERQREKGIGAMLG